MGFFSGLWGRATGAASAASSAVRGAAGSAAGMAERAGSAALNARPTFGAGSVGRGALIGGGLGAIGGGIYGGMGDRDDVLGGAVKGAALGALLGGGNSFMKGQGPRLAAAEKAAAGKEAAWASGMAKKTASEGEMARFASRRSRRAAPASNLPSYSPTGTPEGWAGINAGWGEVGRSLPAAQPGGLADGFGKTLSQVVETKDLAKKVVLSGRARLRSLSQMKKAQAKRDAGTVARFNKQGDYLEYLGRNNLHRR